MNICSDTDKGYTFHYEIISDLDPHIVKEKDKGAIYLGARNLFTGENIPVNMSITTLRKVREEAEKQRHEGYMVYHHRDYKSLFPCKIKTKYYIGKKKLMRMSAKQIETLWSKDWKSFVNCLPQQWRLIASGIAMVYTAQQWSQMTDQERRLRLEDLEDKYYD
jgi:hypothetical protein